MNIYIYTHPQKQIYLNKCVICITRGYCNSLEGHKIKPRKECVKKNRLLTLKLRIAKTFSNINFNVVLIEKNNI